MLALVPAGGCIAPIGRVHCCALEGLGGGASAPLEEYILHPWGSGGAGRAGGVLAGMLVLAQAWRERRGDVNGSCAALVLVLAAGGGVALAVDPGQGHPGEMPETVEADGAVTGVAWRGSSGGVAVGAVPGGVVVHRMGRRRDRGGGRCRSEGVEGCNADVTETASDGDLGDGVPVDGAVAADGGDSVGVRHGYADGVDGR